MKTFDLHALVLQTLSKAVNAYLDLDPASKQRLKKLYTKTMTITLLPLNITVQCSFNETGVHFQPHETLPAHAKIIGTPLQMAGLMMAHTHRQRFFAEDVKIEGEAEFAQEVMELFDRIQIDWEDYFAEWIGDVPAYRAYQLLQKTRSWFSNAEQTMARNIQEYIHEEAKWQPAREALQDFFDDIDTMRTDVDRLEARVKRLYS